MRISNSILVLLLYDLEVTDEFMNLTTLGMAAAKITVTKIPPSGRIGKK